jgi:hypothetical protein
MAESHTTVEDQLQVLDVHIVDILAHLEALLRHSHSIQRALLQMRRAAPPPTSMPREVLLSQVRSHGRDMRRECDILADIIDDLAQGVEMIDARGAAHRPGSHSRSDRRG